MKRVGQVTYELTEEEFNMVKSAVEDIDYYFNHGEHDVDFKREALRGVNNLVRIFID